MSNASIRFYVPQEVGQSEDFKNRVALAGCDRLIQNSGGYVQFSNDSIHLQPELFLPKKLIEYLDSVTTGVTLMVSTVCIEKMIAAVQPKEATSAANMAKEFSLSFKKGQRVAGTNGVSGTFNLLFGGESSKDVFLLFRSFAPGYFPQMQVEPFPIFLKGMGFFQKMKLIFG